MASAEELEAYFGTLIGKHVGIILMCIFGGILNSIMLYMLLHKKQVRNSVHTVYMVQIALTDLLVCLIWLISNSVMTHNMVAMKQEMFESSAQYAADGMNLTTNISTFADDLPSQQRTWRIINSWYNFHYYVNIFLLASMSVERCAAVWKSMRCQRYKYDRKIIIGISIVMWIIALAFTMPEMVNPDLIASESDSPDSLSRVMNRDNLPTAGQQGNHTLLAYDRRSGTNYTSVGLPKGSKWNAPSITTRPYEKQKVNYFADMGVLDACFTLLARAEETNAEYVQSYGNVNLHLCFDELVSIEETYAPQNLDELDGISGNDEDLLEQYGADLLGDDWEKLLNEEDWDGTIDAEIGDIIPLDEYTDVYNAAMHFEGQKVVKMTTIVYRTMITTTAEAVVKHFSEFDGLQSMCYPNLSRAATIYVLVINLALGFFVPFAIIVFSYVSIACLIGRRVRNRMSLSMSETSTTHFHANQSSTDGNAAPSIHLREKTNQRSSRTDSMSRRMSDFMRYVLLRKPHDGVENRSFTDNSEQNAAVLVSSRNAPQSPGALSFEESNYQPEGSDNLHRYQKLTAAYNQCLETANAVDNGSLETEAAPGLESDDATRHANHVRMRSGNTRAKYSLYHDSTNENIPQTIEEHPLETEGVNEEEELLRVSNGSSILDGTSASARTTHSTRLLTRNSGSRRESGGSYGSSMDSMATDQTSLIPCVDKRYSAATTTSALTPPTPVESASPYHNHFFPNADDRVAHARTPSAEINYVQSTVLNDVTRQLYRKPSKMQQGPSGDHEQRMHAANGTPEFPDSGIHSRSGTSRKDQRYSYPHDGASRNVHEDRTSSTWLISRSNSRLNHENHDHDGHKQTSTYNRQSSNNSSNSQPRRKLSSSSKRSTGGSHSSSRKKNIVHKNAEKQLRVSRTLLTYVIVFALCWLPQRITYLLYTTEALMGADGFTCFQLNTAVRILSFISVLLNPAVYILTQRQFQEYVRKCACVKFLRRWYAKCFKSDAPGHDFIMDSRFRVTSERDEEGEVRAHLVQEDRHQGFATCQGVGAKQPYSMQTQTRQVIMSRTVAGQHDIFQTPAMRRDATIDEMKEEEAAAEESLEKEMRRRAAEEEKRRKDDINKNFMASSENEISSNKTSGNKTSSSSTKSDNLNEFWRQWMENGGPAIPPSDTSGGVVGLDSEFDNVETVPGKLPVSNGSGGRAVIE